MNYAKRCRWLLKTQELKTFISIALCALVLLTTTKTFAQSTPAKNNQDIAHARLDAHPTPENSVLFTYLDGGPTLRMPRVLFNPADIPSDPKQPIKSTVVALTFWFPDMTPSGWDSTMTKIFQEQRGEYVPEKDRFRVRILTMFYTDPDWDKLARGKRPPDGGRGYRARPARMRINAHCVPLDDPNCVDETQRFDSGFVGVDMQMSKAWAQTHPNAMENHRQHPESAVYLEKPDSPYELYMNCSGLECDAEVYSKVYHLQYHALFSSAAVRHTDELLRAIEQMMARWSEKNY